jgi:hypothetical protein
MIYIFLIIIIIIILFNVINDLNKKKKIEYFEDSASWSTSSNDVANQNKGLTKKQQAEVNDISLNACTTKLTELVQTQSPLLTGPPGPMGQPGPAGTTLIASGQLANKETSFNKTNKTIPQFVVSRSDGTTPSASLSFMEKISPFTSYQYWQLDINNNLKNRYDNTCMTMSATDNKIYMDTCNPNNANQKWTWDKTNRLISTSNSGNVLKCITTKEIDGINITNMPGCKEGDSSCVKTGKQNFLVVSDCNANDIQDNQVWGFI